MAIQIVATLLPTSVDSNERNRVFEQLLAIPSVTSSVLALLCNLQQYLGDTIILPDHQLVY
jgi:hypothetical protein